MNRQDIFNTVATHLLTQNRRAMGPTSDSAMYACVYRGPDGLKCAAGVLIKDEHYKPELENNNVHSEIVKEALTASLGEGLEFGFINALQIVHDSYNPCDWPVQLQEFAIANGLTMPEVLAVAA